MRKSLLLTILVWIPSLLSAHQDEAFMGETFYKGERCPYALNDYKSLGQSFTTPVKFNILWIVAPSWQDNEGGFTLSLYESPRKKKLFARRHFSNFADNAKLSIYFPEPLPAGAYYWEIHDRTGETKVGLYAYKGSLYDGGCAYFDGLADESIDFVSGWSYNPFMQLGKRKSVREQKMKPTKIEKALPHWIWFPETCQPNTRRYFRFKFELGEPPREAKLLVSADDSYELYLNGKLVGRGGLVAKSYDVKPNLKHGKNVIAASVYNYVGPAGLLLSLDIETKAGKVLRIVSNTDWLSSDVEHENWAHPEFDDSGWQRAVSMGDALSDPWFSRGNIYEFSKGIVKDIEEIDVPSRLFQRLQKEPPARAEVKLFKGVPRLFINNKPVFPLLFVSAEGLADFACDFADIGIHIFQPRYNLRDLWVAPDRYDFRTLERHLARILYEAPEAMFLIFLQLEPPHWRKDKHPNELIKYADGTGFIYDEWGGTKHASFASKLWQDDATAALRALIRYLKESPLRSRIIGYMIANGIYGEWHHFGARHLPDISAPMSLAFRKWAEKEYNTLDDLQAAWGRNFKNFDEIYAPGMQERITMDFGLFRDPAVSKFIPDYYRFFHEHNADVLLHFAKVVKEETAGRLLCGAFNCYLLDNLWIQEGGHLAALKILQSPYIDFIACPYSYQQEISDDAGNRLGSSRGVGGDGGYRVLTASAKLHKKLYFAEIDTATCLTIEPAFRHYGGAGTETLSGSLNALRRDLAYMISEGTAGWLFELTSGWFAHERIMAEIKALTSIGKRSLDKDLSSVAEIAAIYDTDSFYYTSHWKNWKGIVPGENDLFGFWFLQTQNRALHRISAPIDQLYHDDLSLSKDYKLYFIVNCFYLTDEELKALRDKVCKDNSVVVWLYAPGFISPDKLSVERMSELVGIKLAIEAEPGVMMIETTDTEHPITNGAEKMWGLNISNFPRFVVTDSKAKVLGVWKGTNLPAFAIKKFKDWTSIYIGFAPVPTGILRNIAKFAGVHIYSDKPDIVRGNKSYITLVANGDGVREVSLPAPMREAMTGKLYKNKFKLNLKHGEVMFWERR